MATGWTFKDSGGVDIDFDQAFAPRDGYTATAATGFGVAGQDFADRYRASTSTSDRIGIATKFYRGAVAAENDFAVIFRRLLAMTSFIGGGTFDDGDYVTFTISALGYALHYEWRKDGSPISGAPDSATYAFTANTGHSGTYTCRIYNSFSEEISVPRTLTVQSIDAVDIVSIGFDPAPTVVVGDGLTVTAELGSGNYGYVSYQWYRNGTLIPGATSYFYSKYAELSDSGATFRCDVSNSVGNDSASGSTTVYQAPYATITGSTNVAVGGGTGGWSVEVYSPYGLTEVTVGIAGHNTSPTQISGDTYTTSFSWSSPFGNPDVSSAPGSFTLFVQAYDGEDNSLYDSIGVTVS